MLKMKRSRWSLQHQGNRVQSISSISAILQKADYDINGAQRVLIRSLDQGPYYPVGGFEQLLRSVYISGL